MARQSKRARRKGSSPKRLRSGTSARRQTELSRVFVQINRLIKRGQIPWQEDEPLETIQWLYDGGHFTEALDAARALVARCEAWAVASHRARSGRARSAKPSGRKPSRKPESGSTTVPIDQEISSRSLVTRQQHEDLPMVPGPEDLQ